MSADLCLHVSKPAAGFAEKLNGLGRLEPSTNGAATIVVSRNRVDEHIRSTRHSRGLSTS